MKFESKYKNLSFRVNGQRKKFSEGIYETDNKDEIAVLEKMRDVFAEEKKVVAPKKAQTVPAPKK